MDIYKQLLRDAKYALKSCSRDLVNETYGKAKMARNLSAITKEQFMTLNDMLIRDGINNPAAGLK